MGYSDQHDPYRGLRGVRDVGPAREQTALVIIDMQNCFLHPDGFRLEIVCWPKQWYSDGP